MVSWVNLAKWLRRGPTGVGDGFESWKNSKSFEKKLKNSFFATISHGYYIYKTNHTTTKQKRWMVKVCQHYHEFLVRILRLQEPMTRQTQGGRSTREQREGRGVREPKRLGMSQGTTNREPKYGGGVHPKYGSCRGISESNPESMY